MSFQSDPELIQWRVHCASAPECVFDALATAEGRANFWAVEAEDHDGVIHFVFPSGMELHSRILESARPRRFSIKYFGGSVVVFDLESDGASGTDTTMTETGFCQR